ncbi:putative fasciclin-like arabinogalactan protein 20 [Carica papaya]|uniref:putative fasciclin-like arabinogalactan protein 20 n=1 Tax=Carica papaya TaxID=3649 RepID=UPI000B8C87EF|nr:putative fasciclin-like arabinogalactan protein 20 [Carica papaya]
MAAKILLSLILLFSLLPRFTALPEKSVPDAAAMLSNSGFLAMGLTLEFGFQSLISDTVSLTIFAPPDAVFSKSGQPPLALFQLHLSPLYLSHETLKSLPRGTRIPTLSWNHSIFVTSSPSDDHVSLNGVKLEGYPLYGDGSLIVFKIEEFFNPNMNSSSFYNTPCTELRNGSSLVGSSQDHSFMGASQALQLKGFSIMASFLAMQVGRVEDQAPLTVFAPIDDAFKDDTARHCFEHHSLFLKLVVPCKFMWSDLVTFKDGVFLFPTYMEGFKINFTKSGRNLKINGNPIIARDIHSSDWLVVHGLGTNEAERSTSGLGVHNQTGRFAFAFFALWVILISVPFSG